MTGETEITVGGITVPLTPDHHDRGYQPDHPDHADNPDSGCGR
jgi:hypothetical protein